MPRHVIRFGVGSAAAPYIPVWRLWANRSDVYLAQRAMGGSYKISLHKHDWVSQFTKESGVKIFGESRRHARWEPRPPNDYGWTVGPTLIVPWVEWAGEIPYMRVDSDNVTWCPVPPAQQKIHLTVVLSQNDQLPETGGLVDFRENDMYETTPLTLDDGRRVWLIAAIRPIASDEQANIDLVERQFRGFSSSGSKEEMTEAFGIQVDVAEPMIVQFPLGLRHFTFEK